MPILPPFTGMPFRRLIVFVRKMHGVDSLQLTLCQHWRRKACRILPILTLPPSGTWNDFPRYCRCAHRYGASPDARNSDVGFRVAADVSPKAPWPFFYDVGLPADGVVGEELPRPAG
jgi:hypothetical protein